MEFLKTLFWSNIFFEKKINNIKKTKIKDYLLKLFAYKLIFLKFLTFIFILLISAPLTFILRDYWLNNYAPGIVVFNKGMGLSFGDEWDQGIIYLFKIIPIIILLFTLLLTTNMLIATSAIIIFLGGLYNLIDKWLVDYPNSGEPQYDAVVDYIHIWNSVANVPDVFVTIGTVLLLASLIYVIYKMNENDDTEDDIDLENINNEVIKN